VSASSAKRISSTRNFHQFLTPWSRARFFSCAKGKALIASGVIENWAGLVLILVMIGKPVSAGGWLIGKPVVGLGL
jgi:hypothetical protein